MNVKTRVAAAAVALAFASGVAITGCGGGGPPSAQCKSQIARIAALQADARSFSSQVVSTSSYAQFQADIAGSARLLKDVKAEGCPHAGYAGGYRW